MPYDAFISYSHAADDALAPAVQRALQTLARPWNRRRALEVFRDQTGLAVSPALWTSICAGLDDSEYFVLLASPEAAASTWVNQEIDYWSASHPIDRLLPVLTAGEWRWDSEQGDFDWLNSTAVPDALRGKFREEPRHLDLRWAREETDLDLRHSRFREAMAQLAAPMHQMSPQDLESSDVARFRHLVRLRRAVVAALCVLLALVSVAGVLAVQNARQAREQQAVAEQRARQALSLQLLAQAEVMRTQQKTLSLLLTAEAARLDPTEAWDSLVSGFQDSPGLTKIYDYPVGVPTTEATAAVDVNARTYASVTHEAAIQPVVQLWDLRSGSRGAQLTDDELYGLSATALEFSSQGSLAVTYECLERLCKGSPRGIQLWDVATRTGRLLPNSAAFSNLTFSDAGDLLAATRPDGTISVWEVANQTLQSSTGPRFPGTPTGLAFSADNRRLALSLRDDGRIVSWVRSRRTLSKPVAISFPTDTYPQAVRFASNGVLASRDSSGGVSLWSADDGQSKGQLKTRGGAVVDLASGPDGMLATVAVNGSLRLWDSVEREQHGPAQLSGSRDAGTEVLFDQRGALVSVGSDIRYWDVLGWGDSGMRLYAHRGAIKALAVSPEGIVASADNRGLIRLWELAKSRPIGEPLVGHRGAVTALAFDSEGTLASGGQDGTVRLWDTGSGDELQGPTAPYGQPVSSLAFSSDGTLLSGGYGGGTAAGGQKPEPILVWDVASGALVQRIYPGLTGGVASVAFSSQDVFASAGADFLAIWPVQWQSKKLVEDPRLGPYTAVAFSADGQILAASAGHFARGDDRTTALWRIPSGQPLGEPLEAGQTSAKVKFFRALAFSPDGALLAGAGEGGLQFWDVARQQPLGGRLGFSPANSVAVSPDGSLVVAGHGDGAVRAYPATVDGWLASVCDVVSRNLTSLEWESFVGPDTPYDRTCPVYPGG